jgi:hypothetical protein
VNKRCIVSFGKGYNFERGIERLKGYIDTLVHVPFISFTEYPISCPLHQEIPFAFKFYCIQECLKREFESILWLDSSVIIKNDLSDIFQKLETQGYFFIRNWHSVGDYCHDKALKTLNISREESFNIPCLQGGNFGLNFRYDCCKDFFKQIMLYIDDKITFPGPYTNTNNMASINNRVLGHRHDQIAMSVTALRLGMNRWESSETNWFIHDWEFVKGRVAGTVRDVNMSSST